MTVRPGNRRRDRMIQRGKETDSLPGAPASQFRAGPWGKKEEDARALKPTNAIPIPGPSPGNGPPVVFRLRHLRKRCARIHTGRVNITFLPWPQVLGLSERFTWGYFLVQERS